MAWHIQGFLLKEKAVVQQQASVGFPWTSISYDAARFTFIPSSVFLQKLQHISFLKVFTSCCLTYIIIWKHKVTLHKYFAFLKNKRFCHFGDTVLHIVVQQKQSSYLPRYFVIHFTNYHRLNP